MRLFPRVRYTPMRARKAGSIGDALLNGPAVEGSNPPTGGSNVQRPDDAADYRRGFRDGWDSRGQQPMGSLCETCCTDPENNPSCKMVKAIGYPVRSCDWFTSASAAEFMATLKCCIVCEHRDIIDGSLNLDSQICRDCGDQKRHWRRQ